MGEPNEKQDESSAEQEDTSKETETFTKGQVEEAERKGKSDSAAEMGRLTKANADLIKSSQALQTRMAKKQQEDDERELEKYRDEPDRLTQIRERQAHRETQSELDRVKQELDEKDERIKQQDELEAASTKERNAREIAARLEVNPNRLAKLAKFTDGTPEAIEDIAKDLPKVGEPKVPLTPDSGKMIGGKGKKPTLEEVKTASPAEFDAKVKSGDWVV